MFDDQREHDFDVALSYAGEDRTYVAAVARGLREAGVRVFYDEFMTADLWGVDLYGFLDDVYRNRARFAVLFVSHHYVAKTWTSHERQSMQARALNEDDIYLLPVRIDDAELPGLRPTVGYIDARRIDPHQLVQTIKQKIGLTEARRPTITEEVELVQAHGFPSSPTERQYLLSERPIAWEYTLWASVMWEHKEGLEAKWRDHELRLAKPYTVILNADNVRKFPSDVVNYLEAFIRRLNSLFSDSSQEWALGRADEPGDPVKIDHYARSVVSLYEELMDWAAQIRGTRARPEYARLVELAAQLVDFPLESMRAFFDDFVQGISALPDRIAAGEHLNYHLTLKIDLDSSVIDAFLREYERVM